MSVSGVYAQQALFRSAMAIEAFKMQHNAREQVADMLAEMVDASAVRGRQLDISV